MANVATGETSFTCLTHVIFSVFSNFFFHNFRSATFHLIIMFKLCYKSLGHVHQLQTCSKLITSNLINYQCRSPLNVFKSLCLDILLQHNNENKYRSHCLFRLPQLEWTYLALGRHGLVPNGVFRSTNIGGTGAPVLISFSSHAMFTKLTLALDRRSRSETTIYAEGCGVPLGQGMN